MRMTRLDLLRYGKFTDKSVALPCVPRDFHLIVGPNEAGKSTLRDAIQELLFGIENRSRYNFLHAYGDMRLGALIEQGGEQLDFIRTKARAKTLQTAGGSPLPENSLAPFTGQIDRTFFDKMFGLNHERLVAGGEAILSASDDVGQILFQAAAGIAGLGDIRDRLEAEAGILWAKRKAGDREYYIASAELEQAEAALKAATVRTKDWQEASGKVRQIAGDLKLARSSFQALEQERIELERLRRVAPLLTALDDFEHRATDLGVVVLLPESAAAQLANAEQELAVANQSLSLFTLQATELQERIDLLHPDAAILARATDIEALSGTRQQLRNFESDIGKREEEVRVLWQSIQESARQMGWPQESEEAVAQRLPGSLIRSAVDGLIRRHETLTQVRAAAAEALRVRQEEVKGIDAEIGALPVSVIPVSLIAGLAAARALGDVTAQEKLNQSQLARSKRELEKTQHDLGAWSPGIDSLRTLLPPSRDETHALLQRRGEMESMGLVVAERLTQAKAEVQDVQLAISQYKAAHDPVTLVEVLQVRGSRDSTWQGIRNGTLALKDVAPGFEREVAHADGLSDKRHDKAKEETELQSRLDHLHRAQQQVAALALRVQEHAQALDHFDRSWEERSAAMGLAAMPVHRINEWSAARERVLAAADAFAEAQSTQQDFADRVDQARAQLQQSMLAVGAPAQGLELSALLLLADDTVTAATRNQERLKTLATQKSRAEVSIPDLSHRDIQAQAALDAWQVELQKNLKLAHLPLDSSVGAIEAALALFDSMHQQLQRIRDVRVNRIDTMRRDLNDFADAAIALAVDLAPQTASESPEKIALGLDSRLKQGLSEAQELDRLNVELAKATAQSSAASSKIAVTNAGMEPLMRLAGATDVPGLRVSTQRSDHLRSVTSEIDQALKQLLQAGDGLNRAALEAAFEAVDPGTISARLSEIKAHVDEVVEQQNRLSGELNSAETVLGKIAGQDEAARAEAQRQEALARMAIAVERYIKVYTAAKLLRWSIERFRESKQGPMLARASDIFRGLTQGAFSRLIVDYETEPLKLSGQRPGAGLVGIEGMSEGTRDQLYLALRLAALELHLGQATPLPFIADDLFINYDDGRAKAGLEALSKLSEMTQVIFLTHHEHLVPLAQSVFGNDLNVVNLS